jgi:hypothetical protein
MILSKTPINSVLSHMNLAQTLAAIAEPRHRRLAATPKPPVPIWRLEEEPRLHCHRRRSP